jgi:hypothetical protein
MKVQSTLLMMAFALIPLACTYTSSDSSSGTGGASAGGAKGGSGGVSGSGAGGAGTGGSPGTGGATKGTGGSSGGQGGGAGGSSGGSSGGSCTDTTSVTPCGGDVTGTWTVSGCVAVSGTLDLGNLGIGCRSAKISGSRQVSGTWTATADGKYTDKTTTTGSEQLTLDPSCLEVSGTTTTCERLGSTIQSFGYDTLDCKSASEGGCTCAGTIKQSASVAVLSTDPVATGKLTIASNVITTSVGQDDTQYSYCVSGAKMRWTPKTTSPTMSGAIVFQMNGGTGSGGAAGGGAGNTGAGGQPQGGAGGTAVDAATPDAPLGSGGSAGSGGGGGAGAGGTGGVVALGDLPCDLYAAANAPCVAAYSMVRVLSKSYTGPLYQVRKGGGSKNTGTGGTTQDIGAKDGFADSAAQDTFCGTDSCTVSVLYDQSGKKNDLKVAPAGCYTGTASEADYESSATKKSVTVGGHKVYGLYMNPHEGYRNNNSTTMPTGTASQGIYEIADGKHFGTGCCWDFGNASKDNCYNGGTSTMNALFLGTGYWGSGTGDGPWFLGDFEAGVWAGGSQAESKTANPKLPSSTMDFAFGILKTSATNYAIRVGDAQSGDLTTAYDGNLPFSTWHMKGGIILGIGGDNSNSSQGTFFEGAVTTGRPSDETDSAVFANVKAAGYGK